MFWLIGFACNRFCARSRTFFNAGRGFGLSGEGKATQTEIHFIENKLAIRFQQLTFITTTFLYF
jgi:hypothetical protein